MNFLFLFLNVATTKCKNCLHGTHLWDTFYFQGAVQLQTERKTSTKGEGNRRSPCPGSAAFWLCELGRFGASFGAKRMLISPRGR